MEESNTSVLHKTLSKEDFDKICRCCLSPGPTDGIFELTYEETPLVEVFLCLFGTQPDSDDDLPKKICETCIGEVVHCYNFKRSYQASEDILLNIIAIKTEDIEIKSEPPEDDLDKLVKIQLDAIKATALEQKIKINEQKPSRVFTCSCDETFASKLKLQQHRKETSHQMPRNHLCKTCGKLFTRVGLYRHAKTHDVIKRHGCNHCTMRFASSFSLKRHMMTHTGEKPHVCDFCCKSFGTLDGLKVHRRIHTGERPYLCPLCGRAFGSKPNLIGHMEIHNKQKIAPKANATNIFVCDECGRSCYSRGAYKLHLYRHGLGKGKVIKDDQHQCEICKKFFSSRSTLLSHVKKHNKEKRYLCNACGKRFHTKTTLESHILCHTGEKSFKCEFCEKKCARQTDLQKHLLVHTDERRYACTLCPKKFKMSSQLTNHLTVHTGERPYVCKFCDKAFPRRHTLDVHLRMHTGEKPYKCDDCTSTFYDSGSLKKHKQRKHQQV